MGQVAQCDNALPFHPGCPACTADNSQAAAFLLSFGACLNVQKPLKGIQQSGIDSVLGHTGVNFQWSYSRFILVPLQNF